MAARAGVRMRSAVVAAGAWAVLAAASPALGADAAGRCGACHPAEKVAFLNSRHASEEITCVACHGGDATAVEVSAAHGRGFRGRPGKRDIPGLCASCHSDQERMRPYNLPVDQLALYQTSAHGHALARGDLRVAVCSDCHGAHDILPPEDPASRTYVLNIPRTCGTCHGDEKLLGRGATRGGVYDAYASSVHAKSLFEKGNLKAPTCVSCHGVHGANPPALGDVDKVCGQCHTAERRYFAEGPHFRLGRSKGAAECQACHGNHAITASDPARLASQCATCHGKDSGQARAGVAMYAEYRQAAEGLEKAAAAIQKADAVPLPTEDFKARLEEARTYLSEALPAGHAVTPGLASSFAARSKAVSTEIEREIGEKLGERAWRYVGLALFWFYLVLTLMVLRRVRRPGPRGA
jgi:predicted CXXCH cytochrome family protein